VESLASGRCRRRTALDWSDVKSQPPRRRILGRRERLFDHGDAGVEAMFYQDEEFLVSRVFATRELAVAWANQERKAIVEG
jgi:hypothetical protein